MTTISDLYEAFGRLKIKEQLPEMIKKTEYELITKVISQHKKGILATSRSIRPAYVSKNYSSFKNALNSAPGYGTPDIHVTGAYDADMHVTIKGEDYEIDSGVDYAKSASITQYGNDLNLPSEESKAEYWNEALLPQIQEYITEITGLEFT